MSQSRPSTPSTTPRRPLASSSRPSSRASSRSTSPNKPNPSLNNTLPFPPTTTLGQQPTFRNVIGPIEGGRTSPTKRLSGMRPTTSPIKRAGGGSTTLRTSIASARAGPPSSSISTSSMNSAVSISSQASRRGGGGSMRTREESVSSRSSDASCSNAGDTTDDDHEREDDQLPRRRPGFGPMSTPKKTRRTGNVTETETETEAGFMTAEEGMLTSIGGGAMGFGMGAGLRGSIVERSEAEEDGGTQTETEEQEEERDGKTENVVVCLRVRPTKASSAPSAPIYEYTPSKSTLILAPLHPTLLKRGGKTSDEYEFRFDLLHVSPDPTEKLYDRKIRPVVKAALNGFNGTVFAYGQTASGKTHTMMGSSTEPGIIPLAIDELFSHIHKQNTDRTYSLRVSFLEIYNEHLRDLLASPSSSNPNPRQPELVEGGLVKNLEERPVSMPQEVLEVLREGEQRRRVGQTDWNERSSRSHCVFIVTIESMSKYEDGSARTSKLNLIDLAGSESATGQEERRKEGSFINKSLLTLGTVIGKLTEPHHSTAHIPYRDSKLTRLLQPALSGNSRVAVVCTISPDVEQATETLSTLKFAKRAKMVVTKAERGVLVTDQMMLKQYAAQVEKLRDQIKSVEGGNILRERDIAARRADEAERKGKQAEDALAEKELELSKLRSQLAHTQSLILTGPSLEANARRVSGSFAGSMLSPSRSRSLNCPGGKRTVSEMGALGLGTPLRSEMSWRSGLGETVSRTGEEQEILKEKELALQRQLEEANVKLASLSAAEEELVTLRSQVLQLQRSSSLARLDADKSASASEDRRSRIRELEQELAEVRESLRTAEADRTRLTAEMSSLRLELDRSNQATLDAIESLKALETRLLSAQDVVKEKDHQLLDLRDTLSSLEQQIANKEAASTEQDSEKDETIASFERQVASVKQELAVVTAAKAEALKAALDEVSDVRRERDLALKSVGEAERRIREVEDMAETQASRHDLAEEHTRREKDAATAALQADIDRLKEDLVAKLNRVAQLERTVETFENLEMRRKKYESDQRSGLDKLKSRMDDMRAKASTPVQRSTVQNASTPSILAASTGSSSGELSQGQQQQVKELQVRNGELLARVAKLERDLDSNAAARAEELRETQAREHRFKLGEVEAKAEDWRQKYLAAQRLLDRLTSRSQLDSSTSSSENQPPTPLANLKLESPFSRMSLSTAAGNYSRPTLNFSSSSLSRASSTSSSRTPLPPPSPSPPLQPSSSWTTNNRPPPLPSSPHQRTSAAKERNIRRKTIAKDLVNLQASKVVDQRREGWDSPNASPTKAEMEQGGRGSRTSSWE